MESSNRCLNMDIMQEQATYNSYFHVYIAWQEEDDMGGLPPHSLCVMDNYSNFYFSNTISVTLKYDSTVVT